MFNNMHDYNSSLPSPTHHFSDEELAKNSDLILSCVVTKFKVEGKMEAACVSKMLATVN
jgi:hypothetical protein